MNVEIHTTPHSGLVTPPLDPDVRVINTRPEQAEEVSVLLKKAYDLPPTYEAETFFRPEDIRQHIKRFPEGQFVAMLGGKVVGMASTMLTDRSPYEKTLKWIDAIGGRGLRAHKPEGT